jgi:hypothetical protein
MRRSSGIRRRQLGGLGDGRRGHCFCARRRKGLGQRSGSIGHRGEGIRDASGGRRRAACGLAHCGRLLRRTQARRLPLSDWVGRGSSARFGNRQECGRRHFRRGGRGRGNCNAGRRFRYRKILSVWLKRFAPEPRRSYRVRKWDCLRPVCRLRRLCVIRIRNLRRAWRRHDFGQAVLVRCGRISGGRLKRRGRTRVWQCALPNLRPGRLGSHGSHRGRMRSRWFAVSGPRRPVWLDGRFGLLGLHRLRSDIRSCRTVCRKWRWVAVFRYCR